MATEATAIISAAEAREVLRLLPGEAEGEHSRLIDNQLTAAVSWVSTLLGRPVLERQSKQYLIPGARGEGRDSVALHLGYPLRGPQWQKGTYSGGGYQSAYGLPEWQGLSGQERPLIITDQDLRRVDQVQYWSTEGRANQAPDATVADIGYLRLFEQAPWDHEQHPPDSGWPNRLYETAFIVSYTSFIEETHENWSSIQEAVRYALYHTYNGMPMVKDDSTMIRILEPFRY